MTVELVSFWSAECGGINMIDTAAVLPGAVSSPSPPHVNESYCLRLDWKEVAQAHNFTLGASDWYTVICHVRFDDVTPTVAINFLNFEEGAPSYACAMLSLNTSGYVELYDANGTLISTSATQPFTANTWHKVSMKLKHAAATDLQVKIDGAIVFDETSFDATNGSTDGTVYVYNGSSIETLWVDKLLIFKDDGAAIDTNSVEDDTHYCRCYCDDAQGATPDAGATLDGGTVWSDTADVPENTATYARYDVAPIGAGGPTTRYGLVYCNGGTRSGPFGDSAIGTDDEIVGAGYVCLARSYQQSPSGRMVDLEVDYGSSSSASTSTKYLNLPANWNHERNLVHFLDGAHADCPTKMEYAAQGVQVFTGTLNGQGWMAEMYSIVVYKEIPVTAFTGIVHAGMIDG